MKQVYRWQVTLDGHTVSVSAHDKLEATRLAAKALGVRWSVEAKRMYCVKMSVAR